jgi:predicted ATP-grasp superfamily ATP-dependent carboligase
MYLQQRIDGPSCAAVFVGDGQHAALIGLTLQLIGEPSFHAEPFHYCGSIGPLPISTGLRAHRGRLGDVLAGEFALVGLFGVDGIIANDEFWPVEVNPRYTASVEILEAGLCVPAMSLHRDACVNHRLSGNFTTPSDGTVIGKAILFADKAVVVPEWPEVAVLKLGRGASPMALPMMADIPNVGERIGAGRPICTVFAVHSSVQECRNSLVHAARAAYLETQRLHHLTR